MKTLEVADKIKKDFRDLEPDIKAALSDRACENCGICLDKMDIDYVVCSNGDVRWWHTPKYHYKRGFKVMEYCYNT